MLNQLRLMTKGYQFEQKPRQTALIRLQNCVFHKKVVPLHLVKKRRRILRILNTIK